MAFKSIRYSSTNRCCLGVSPSGRVCISLTHSIIVEVSQSLYMNEDTGERSAGFDGVRLKVRRAVESIIASVREGAS